MSDEDFEHLPINAAHARLAGRLPRHHRHPFDRMLVAQAQAQGLTLVTRDRAIRKCGSPLLIAAPAAALRSADRRRGPRRGR